MAALHHIVGQVPVLKVLLHKVSSSSSRELLFQTSPGILSSLVALPSDISFMASVSSSAVKL